MRCSVSFLRLLGFVGLSAFFVGCGGEVEEKPLGDPGSTLWARRFGRLSYEMPVGLAGVESGGVIVSGRYYGDVDFGGGVLPAPGNNYQAYVARYDGEGNHVYSRSFGDAFAEATNDVAALPDGSALVVGTFGWELDLDGIVLPCDGADDAFVAKLDPAGKVVWAQTFGGAGWQRGFEIAAMPDGGAIVAGKTEGAVDLGVGTPQSKSNAVYLVRLDPEGAPMWARMLPGGDGFVSVFDVAARGDTIVAVGQFSSPLDVGLGVDLVPEGYYDGFVVAYDFDGDPVWSRKVGGTGFNDDVHSVAFTEDGGLVLTGEVEGNIDLGGGLHPTTNGFDGNTFLLELDAASNYRRSFIYGGDGYDYGEGIAVAKDGSVLLTGQMMGRMSFGAGALASSATEGAGDVFVAELDAEREPVFLRRFGDGEEQSGQAVAVDGQGRVFVAGAATGVVDFGLGPTPGSGYYETFLVAFAP